MAYPLERRRKRREKMQKLFDEQLADFYEDNNPTQVATFLEDAIRAMPYSIRQSPNIQWEALFRSAMDDAGLKKESEPPAFKLDDYVMVVDPDATTHGKEGTVYAMPNVFQPKIQLSFDNGWTGWYTPDQLELIGD